MERMFYRPQSGLPNFLARDLTATMKVAGGTGA
jgi:hypothetical protein